MIVVDHFDERFDLVATGLFLLSHFFRHFAWITRDTSDDSVSVTSFIAAIVVRLSRSTSFELRKTTKFYFDDNGLSTGVATGQNDHHALSFHDFHHG